MTEGIPVHLVDTVNLVCPQLDFLAGVLCLNDCELNAENCHGLSSILNDISEQLQTAVRESEVPNGDT
jgi:hypothetical protein